MFLGKLLIFLLLVDLAFSVDNVRSVKDHSVLFPFHVANTFHVAILNTGFAFQ